MWTNLYPNDRWVGHDSTICLLNSGSFVSFHVKTAELPGSWKFIKIFHGMFRRSLFFSFVSQMVEGWSNVFFEETLSSPSLQEMDGERDFWFRFSVNTILSQYHSIFVGSLWTTNHWNIQGADRKILFIVKMKCLISANLVILRSWTS